MSQQSTIVSLLSFAGTAFSVGLFLSPIPTVLALKKEGESPSRKARERDTPISDEHTTEFDQLVLSMSIPYIAQTLNCVLWLTYGIIIGSGPITATNAAGLALSCYYLFVCASVMNVAAMDTLVKRVSIVLVVYNVALVVLNFVIDIEYAADVMGLLAAGASIIMFASPLSSIREVIRTRNAQSIPWLTTIAALCNTLAWFFFGSLVDDAFVTRCNGIGLLIVLLQLGVKLFYGSKEQAFDKKAGHRPSSDNLRSMVIHQTKSSSN